MPRKTKETNEITKSTKSSNTADIAKNETQKSTKKVTKSVAKKDVGTKSKKTSTSKSVTKKAPSTSKSVVSVKSNTKKSNTKTATKKTSAKKSTTTSRKTNTKSNIKKAVTKKSSNKNKKANIDIVEYYDLPYRYNQTVVKVLAQTPNNLFIYWDISDKDRELYKEKYGENFFETTKPVLIIHNTTLNYSFEIDINDFANSWYLHVNDSKCDYKIELGRRPIAENPKIDTNYIYISTSNEIESPNDHVLFNKEQKMVYFRNTKTGVQIEKPISANLSFIRNMGKIYDIYDIKKFYKVLYKNENIEEIYDLSNPSSGNPSSGNPSSNFR